MKPLILELHYDQFASHVKPDEWIGFCWWVQNEPDKMFEVEELIRTFAEEATQKEKDSWSEDTLGCASDVLDGRLRRQDTEDDEEDTDSLAE